MRPLFIKIFVVFFYLSSGNFLFAQNPAIKCYFNHPVNTSISTGVNAVYLNGTFPDTIAAYINRAKFTIDIAMYNYTASAGSNVARIATAANAAAARGVVIRWIYNGTSATNNTGLSLLSPLIKTFAAPDNSDYIMHNKFMVIDVNAADSNNAILQTGSYNFSDAQTSSDYNNIVFVQSKQVALAYYHEFNKMWGGTGPDPNPATAVFSTSKTASAQTLFNVNGTSIEVYFSPKDNNALHLQNSISTSNFDLFFGVYTFTDNNVANLIKTKYNNGVFVRGIIDENSLPYNAYATLNPVLGSSMITFSGSALYHSKVMLIDALNPESDPIVFTGSFNWTSQAQNSNDENTIVIHNASIANQYYQSLCKDYTNLGGIPCVAAPCPGANTIAVSNVRGTTYQWQVDTGSGFINITDNSSYTGSNSVNLQILNAPSSWYGYKYRCVVDATNFSAVMSLQFTAYWNGSISTAWENPGNWNCGIVPDINTDVIINKEALNYPQLNSTTSCRSVHVNKGAAATMNAGANLILTGN